MPYIFKKYYPARKIFFFLGEGFLIFLSVNVIYYLFRGHVTFIDNIVLYGARAFVATVFFQLSLYFFDLYDLGEILSHSDVATRIFQAVGLGCIFLAFVYYFFPIYMISIRIFWYVLAAVVICVFFWRYLYNHLLIRKMFSHNIVILGTGKMAHNIARELDQKRDAGFEIAYFVGDATPTYSLPQGIPVTNRVEQLPNICQEFDIERIVVAMDDRRGKTPIKELMDCKFKGFPVEYGVHFYERLAGKIFVERMNPASIIFSSNFKKSRLQTYSKLTIDFILALFGLTATLPITIASAIIIKLESPGPVFYFQERVGLHGKPFKLIKFRSMHTDAEKNGPVWAMEDDSRVTRYGRFIRKSRIDELPQMLNVLKGDMSFVGPRPERPVFVEQLAQTIPYYSIRHNVKPGISGWAQVCYPYGASEEDALRKLEFDLYYIKYMSLQIDFWVIFQTIKTVLFQIGSR